ncbi:hypothetical protein [Radiobacillus sp. PE A8.2]|uniref:hypothetical protein n=1 Tax=Radiobacillus sp. PE A8.2 TaxID=3380349 RepID=UPI00388EE69D
MDKRRWIENLQIIDEEKVVLDDHLTFLRELFLLFMRMNPVYQLTSKYNEMLSEDEVEEMNALEKAKHFKKIMFEVDLSELQDLNNQYINDGFDVVINKMIHGIDFHFEELTKELNSFLYEYERSDFQNVLEITKRRMVHVLSSQDELLDQMETGYKQFRNDFPTYFSILSKKEKLFNFNKNKNDYFIYQYNRNYLAVHNCAIEYRERIDKLYNKVLDDFIVEYKRHSLTYNDKVRSAVTLGFDYRAFVDGLKLEVPELNINWVPIKVEMNVRLYNNILKEMVVDGLSIRSENFLRTMYGL